MMKRIVFFCAVLVAGCGPPYTESLVSPDVRVRVMHPDAPGGSRGHNDGERQISTNVFYWEGPEAGEVEVVVDRRRLRIDGRGFGTVEPGDLVVIDATAGKSVKVNGKARPPDLSGD